MLPSMLVMCNPAPTVRTAATEGEWANRTVADMLQTLHLTSCSSERPTLYLSDEKGRRFEVDEALPEGGTLRAIASFPMDRPLPPEALLRADHKDFPPCSMHAAMRVSEMLLAQMQASTCMQQSENSMPACQRGRLLT